MTNQVIVTGNVGANPELHKKAEGSAGVVTLNLAENVSRFNEKTKKYEQSHTNWFPIRAFGGLGARVRARIKKGDRITVFGKLRTYQYEEEGGTIRYGFEILADDVIPSSILTKSDNSKGDFENFADDGVGV